ncbi:MAG: ABC transporter substrate-binding protein [Alphaproteobacteria bacterium]|nr:MAG: ABC transporter substrate-binding protein [Alphaproteobacteria bacterium]
MMEVGMVFWLFTFPIRHFKIFSVACLLALLIIGSAQAAERDMAAESFIQSVSDSTYNVLNDPELSLEERKNALHTIVLEALDFKRIGLFTLASYRRRVSQDEVLQFLDAFDDYAIAIYENRLGDYGGERIQVVDSLVRKKSNGRSDVIVESAIHFQDGSAPLPVNWRLIEEDGAYRVVDIQVIGVWMALEQRAQFNALMSQSGGDIHQLINHLKGVSA